MIKIILKLSITIIILSLISSCIAPPEDIKTTNLLKWIALLLPKINDANLDAEKQKNFVKNEIQSKKQLLAFYKNHSIYIHSKEEKKSNFIYSIDDNSFILKKSIYVTSEKDDLYISFDSKKWILIKAFSTELDFEFDYEFNSKINEKNDRIDIYYTNAISVKKELKNVIEFKKNKPIHKLDSGMTLSTNDKESLSIDLQKEILYIPKDTIFSGELKIIGNVFESKKTPDALIITAMRNIYLYINKKILNLSFDQQTWGLSTILSVKFSRYLLVKSKDKNRIHFCLNVELSFKE